MPRNTRDPLATPFHLDRYDRAIPEAVSTTLTAIVIP